MTAAQHKQMQGQPASPFNVKGQLEATANRFWTSVSMANKNNDVGDIPEGAIKIPGVPVGIYKETSSTSIEEEEKKTPCNHKSSFQFIVNSMFLSCTTGGNDFDVDSNDGSAPPSLLKHATRPRTVTTSVITPTSITPTSSNGESSTAELVTPLPLHKLKPLSAVKTAIQGSSKNLFKNNHEIAQEAIQHLRQQHQRDHADKIVNDSLHDSEQALDTDLEDSLITRNPSLLSNNPSTLSVNHSLLSNNRTITSSMMLQESGQVKQQSQPRMSSLKNLISSGAGKTNAKAAKNPTGRAPLRSHQEHSFFPASKPRDPPGDTRQEIRLRDKLRRRKGVPKEVTSKSPIRLKNRNTNRQKQILNRTNTDDLFAGLKADGESDENRGTNDSWDMGNDGISDITQSTVDRMTLAIAKHVRVFPEEAVALNRVRSDRTDPAPKQRPGNDTSTNNNEDQFFPIMPGGDVAGFTRTFTPPRGVGIATKGMTPPSFTRNHGSTGMHSFCTKTTQSTNTNDFANAWKIDEQNFWETEVFHDTKKDIFINKSTSLKSSNRNMAIKHPKRNGASTTATSIATMATTPTTSFSLPKSPPSSRFVRAREMFLTDNEKLMDNMVRNNTGVEEI